ncbi:MAG TPA: L,D-transpeptidase/peptidoglycan binding protein [Thermoleophilaceae bacterium]|nr:L,D-transpeptidase/peptidoglycan binding protein [Thermoleophilaceae bacterium]
MKSKAFTFVAVLVVLLIAGSVAVYAYDSSRSDRIAEGVTVGGVAVGGLSADEARVKVRRQVAARIEKPIAVTYGKTRFTLSAEDAGIRADVGGMVDDAIEASRDDNVLARVTRDLRGDEEDVEVSVSATYSPKAAQALVTRVGDKLDREPKDATLDFPSLDAVKEQDGIAVKRGQLRRLIGSALLSPSSRTVEAPVKATKAEVTRDELAKEYPTVLVADHASYELRLYKDLKLVKTYTVAFGAAGYDTPRGLYSIQNKAVDPAWSVPNSDWAGDLAGTVVPGGSPENPLKARWLGIYDGAGIHGTDDIGSLGTAASHGCIRMAVPDVIDLYDRVEVGAPIYIG